MRAVLEADAWTRSPKRAPDRGLHFSGTRREDGPRHESSAGGDAAHGRAAHECRGERSLPPAQRRCRAGLWVDQRSTRLSTLQSPRRGEGARRMYRRVPRRQPQAVPPAHDGMRGDGPRRDPRRWARSDRPQTPRAAHASLNQVLGRTGTNGSGVTWVLHDFSTFCRVGS